METITSLSPKIWELVPEAIKSVTFLELFERQIKLWITDKCPCCLCKIYKSNVGFV